MSELEGSFDNSENSGETESIKLLNGRGQRVLIQYVNSLDVEVDIKVVATRSEDKANFNELIELRGTSDTTPATLTLSSGAIGSDFFTEPWEVVRVDITPVSSPSSGNFVVRSMRGE